MYTAIRTRSIFLLTGTASVAFQYVRPFTCNFIPSSRQASFAIRRRSANLLRPLHRPCLDDVSPLLLSFERSLPTAKKNDNPSFSSTDCTQSDDPFQECWSANSWSVNPYNDTKIDRILQALVSPAPQSFYIIQRALSISDDCTMAFRTCDYLTKEGYQFVLRRGAASAVAGVDWTLSQAEPGPEWYSIPMQSDPQLSTLQLANEALKLVLTASDAQTTVDEPKFNHLIDTIQQQLYLTLATDIRGRTAADTAFVLALAGVTNESIFQSLVRIAKLELERVGRRTSCRPKDILHVVEKLAASGVRGEEVEQVYRLAADCLVEKGQHLDVAERLSTPASFDLLSPRPLLWLWRFSARLAKPRERETNGELVNDATAPFVPVSSTSWFQGFKDTSRPLVVDIGCGLGVSLLGLASLSDVDCSNHEPLIDKTQWRNCNYLGGDLSQLAVRFAQGIATRWVLTDRLQYTCASADCLLDQVASMYRGQVSLLLLQFPTPFRLEVDNGDGNTQLPVDAETGFMASRTVMNKIASLLNRSGGRLLIQSNCEDVAVRMRDMAMHTGLQCVAAADPVSDLNIPTGGRLPQRTEAWILSGGKRAIGSEWSVKPLLPDKCVTETEVSCQLQATPIHRCLLAAPPMEETSYGN